MRRLLAIGLDAADLGFIERLVARGRLPTLGRAFAGAPRAEVSSPWAYRAELPWTTFLSGRRPEENRYWGTVCYDPGSYSTSEAGAYLGDPFYAVPGVTTIAFDVPHVALSPRLEGAQVTAWGAHSPQYPRASRPAGLLAELDRTVGQHPAFDVDSQPGWWSEPYLSSLTGALLEGARRRAEAMTRLLAATPDWRFAITAFSEPHSAGHHLWHGVDPGHPLHSHPGAPAAAARLEAVYRGVDQAVGRVVAAAGDDVTLALFSVHGMQGNGGDLLALHLGPELLHRDQFGWARVRDPRWRLEGPGWVEPARGQEAYDVIARGLAAHRGDAPASPPDAVDRVAGAVRALRRQVRRELRRRAPGARPWYQLEATVPEPAATAGQLDALVGARRPLDYLGTSLYQRWWPHQRSFALPSFSDLHVRVNLGGRERGGVVPAGGYERELGRVEQLLSDCRNARTGRPVVADVLRTRRPGADEGPDGERPPADLVVLAAEPVDVLEHPRLGRIGPVPFLRTGEHRARGWLAVAPPEGELRLPTRVGLEELGGLLRELALANTA